VSSATIRKVNCLLLFGMAIVSCAWAQEAYILGGVIENPETHKYSSTMQNTASTYSPLKLHETESRRQGDFYILGGRGTASPGGDTGFYFQLGFREHITKYISAGITYLNEGHPDLHEAGSRDGFALTGWYRAPIWDRLRLEVGAGPYFSMNTTWRVSPDQEYNEMNLGLLASLALVYPLSNSGMNLRAQFSEVMMPGSFSTHSLMLGLGVDLNGISYARKYSKEQDIKYTLSILGGGSLTTRCNNKVMPGFELELQRRISERLSLSVAGISEGSTGLSDRAGVAGQLWFLAPELGRLILSAGFGPYIAQENNMDNKGTKLLGLASIDAKFMLTEKLYGLFRFNRAISGYDKDQDMLSCGAGIEF